VCDDVFQRDLDAVFRHEANEAAGDSSGRGLHAFHLRGLSRKLSPWQFVLHGDTSAYREGVVTWMCQQERWKQARKFALCGRGDVGQGCASGSALRVRPRGCGSRLCARCSRKYGRRYYRRVAGWLGNEAHGELVHVVFTQRQLPFESLSQAMGRFQGAFLRVTRRWALAGVAAGLVSFHPKVGRAGGWHFHAHAVLELRGVTLEDFVAAVQPVWWAAQQMGGAGLPPLFARVVCGAGAALAGLAKGEQGEFWEESPDQATRVLQYVVRDMVQGVDRWGEGLDGKRMAEGFCDALADAKMHRTYGKWRRAHDAEDVEEVDLGESDEAPGTVTEKDAKKGALEWFDVGTMDSILYRARSEQEFRSYALTLVSRPLHRSPLTRRLSAALASLVS